MKDAYELPVMLLLSIADVPLGGSLWLPAVLAALLLMDLVVTVLRR